VINLRFWGVYYFKMTFAPCLQEKEMFQMYSWEYNAPLMPLVAPCCPLLSGDLLLLGKDVGNELLHQNTPYVAV